VNNVNVEDPEYPRVCERVLVGIGRSVVGRKHHDVGMGSWIHGTLTAANVVSCVIDAQYLVAI
jgi:hypothetical protein